MKSIGVYTKDFSLYHDLIKTLRRRNIPYVSLSSLEDVPRPVGVILTSHKEIHNTKSPKVIAADAYENINHAVDLALQMLIGKDMYEKIYIGIDPGEHPGIAVLGDDILLQKTYVNSPKQVFSVVKRFLKEYPAKQSIIRIGHGSTIIRNRIINKLIQLETPIEIVDETKTTSSQKVSRHKRDKEAAATIATVKGGKVQSELPVKPTRGDIKRVQERSRKMTEGKFSIPEETALKVLNGEMTLKEAIEKERKC